MASRSTKSSYPAGHCPLCGDKKAVCIIGDFWICTTKGCKNGPELPQDVVDHYDTKQKDLGWDLSEITTKKDAWATVLCKHSAKYYGNNGGVVGLWCMDCGQYLRSVP